MANEFGRDEVQSIYVDREERFVVSLVVGYSEEDLAHDGGEVSPRAAAKWALELTRDEGSNGTHWFVYDRHEQRMHSFEQSDFDEGQEGI